MSLCLSVWTFIGSAPGPDTDIRPVSLEPAWLEGGPLRNNFPSKWPVAKLPNKNVMPLMLFYGKIFLYIFAVHFERAHF